MAKNIVYHAGGLLADAPAQNIAYQHDGATGLYTAWDADGVQTEQRPLTAEETKLLADADAEVVRGGNERDMRTRADAALADLRTIRDSTGTLTGLQLSNAVRMLARVLLVLARLYLRRLDATD